MSNSRAIAQTTSVDGSIHLINCNNEYQCLANVLLNGQVVTFLAVVIPLCFAEMTPRNFRSSTSSVTLILFPSVSHFSRKLIYYPENAILSFVGLLTSSLLPEILSLLLFQCTTYLFSLPLFGYSFAQARIQESNLIFPITALFHCYNITRGYSKSQ